MSETIKTVSDATFESDVLQSSGPVLVDYWAEWCGPCKMVAPILDEVSKDYAGKLTVAKMNVDENQSVPAKYGIRGIPTLMLFKDGAIVGTKVGALSKSQLTQFIDSAIRRTPASRARSDGAVPRAAPTRGLYDASVQHAGRPGAEVRPEACGIAATGRTIRRSSTEVPE